ncbi:MAG: hypothetical protein E7357_04040 [Clostridiales bacterium]|nr:hypothetical protein [Clostridiales bacterium]
MNKLLTKTVKKVNLMTVIMGVVLALAIVITAIFGINYAASADSGKTMTVSVNGYFYNENKEEIETVCEDLFEKADVKVSYKQHGEMNGDESEIMYVFDASTTDKEMDALETALETAFAAKATADEDWGGAFITVSAHEENLLVNIPLSYFLRALGGVALFTGLAFVYVSIRRKLHMGVLTAACAFAAFVMSAAVICLARIPFTTSSLYVIALAPMVATVICLFMQNKLATTLKSSENADDMQAVINSAATKEALAIVAVGGVALVIVGAVATVSTTWFAVTAFVGLLVSAFVGWLFAPAAYLPIKAIADKCAAKNSGYVGAKKSAKEKKVAKKLEEIAVEEKTEE